RPVRLARPRPPPRFSPPPYGQSAGALLSQGGPMRTGHRGWCFSKVAGVHAFALPVLFSALPGCRPHLTPESRSPAAALVGLSAPFQPQVLVPPGEAPLELRMFPGAVKTDSRGRIITGSTSDPVKNIVGAQAAGDRAGIARFAKILFGVQYNTGRPNP